MHHSSDGFNYIPQQQQYDPNAHGLLPAVVSIGSGENTPNDQLLERNSNGGVDSLRSGWFFIGFY